MEDYEKKEAEKKVKPASKRKSDIKFVHENGDVSSVGDDTPKKKRGRGDTKEDKEPSPVTPEDSKRGGRAGAAGSCSTRTRTTRASTAAAATQSTWRSSSGPATTAMEGRPSGSIGEQWTQ